MTPVAAWMVSNREGGEPASALPIAVRVALCGPFLVLLPYGARRRQSPWGCARQRCGRCEPARLNGHVDAPEKDVARRPGVTPCGGVADRTAEFRPMPHAVTRRHSRRARRLPGKHQPQSPLRGLALPLSLPKEEGSDSGPRAATCSPGHARRAGRELPGPFQKPLVALSDVFPAGHNRSPFPNSKITQARPKAPCLSTTRARAYLPFSLTHCMKDFIPAIHRPSVRRADPAESVSPPGSDHAVATNREILP